MVYVPEVFVPNQKKEQRKSQTTPVTNAHALPATASTRAYMTPSAPSASNNEPLPDFGEALNHPSPPRPTEHKVATPASVPPQATDRVSASTLKHAFTNPLFQKQATQAFNGISQQFSSSNSNSNSNSNAQNSSGHTQYGNVQNGNTQYGNSQYGNTMPGPQQTSQPAYSGASFVQSASNMAQCQKIDYEIKGNEMQLVEIVLGSQQTVVAEASTMIFLDDSIEFKAGNSSDPKAGVFTHFQNNGHMPARVAFAAPYPGSIVPINMATIGDNLICQKGALLCAAHGTNVSVYFSRQIGAGKSFVLLKLEGNGMAFVHGRGTVIRRDLRNERLRVNAGCLVAFTKGIDFDNQLVQGPEGLSLAKLSGTGTVYLQSLAAV